MRISLSANEVAVNCSKAALACGLEQGLADEAGRALAWLAGRGYAPIAGFLALLDALPRRPARLSFDAAQGRLRAAGATLSVLRAAPSLLDHWLVLGDAARVLSARLDAAALLPAYARARGLDDLRFALAVPPRERRAPCWSAAQTLLLGPSSRCRAPAGAWLFDIEAVGDRLSERSDDAAGDPANTGRRLRARIDQHSWAALQARVARTRVPASEQSRLSGAGAGLVDTD